MSPLKKSCTSGANLIVLLEGQKMDDKLFGKTLNIQLTLDNAGVRGANITNYLLKIHVYLLTLQLHLWMQPTVKTVFLICSWKLAVGYAKIMFLICGWLNPQM